MPVVPQGGNTGLVGGGVPDDSGAMAVLSLGRLNRIRAVDPLNDTITVEAGCVLETVQNAAAEANRLFPLALGAQGSAQIGGNLSSNAGGIDVLRYGMARALVLGLEVVLADGRIWDGLRALRKDNTGYDLKQLFIGAEGTLGVITAAVLRLVPRPRERQTAWLGVASPEAAVALLALFRERLGETVGAFELMAGPAVELVLRYLPGARLPLPEPAPWYVLAEVAWSFEDGLGGAPRAGAGGGHAAGPGPGRRDRGERGAAQGDLGAAREPHGCDGARGCGAAPRRRGAGLAGAGADRAGCRSSSAARSRACASCRSAISATATCTTTCCSPRR